MESKKRSLYTTRIIYSFIIATLIFSGAFLLGYMVSYFKLSSVGLSQDDIQYNILSLELEKQLIKSSCNLFGFYSISSELDEIGSTIGLLEERFGKDDKKVIRQKEAYSILEVQHFLLIKDYNERCDKEIPILLFLYSNRGNFIDVAEKTGYILSSLKKQNKDIMIYSFDYDLEINLINILKRKYNITTPNNVIYVNDEVKLENIQNIQEIKNYVN